MKLKFKNQQFQTDAVNAVCGLFSGQEKNKTTFSLGDERQLSMNNDFGIGNALLLDDDALLSNLREVQKKNNLPQSDGLSDKSFCIEMETATGKTLTYSRTILELNRKYGFTKFIIVVPSVAIREGVHKSLEITRDYLAAHYDNVPYRYFIYNSAKISEIRRFATSSDIEIMVINIDAFKKSENIINQEQDKLNGETAMRYIQDTNSIVILDEPQSIDNTPKSKEAIALLKPLCVLRYSATHREKINLLYRLTPVDAYQMGLVKQISVSSNTIDNYFNKPYIRLLSVSMDNGFTAKIEIDVIGKGKKVERKTKTVRTFADLFVLSGDREIYEGYIIQSIYCDEGDEKVEFQNLEVVKLGKAIGSVDENLLKRAQIKRTIETHFDKELMLYDKGIKVLSLFFIDEVKKYRTEDADKGIYAEMFEECYNELLALEKYSALKDKFSPIVEKAHDGYFSQDKKGRMKDTKGDTQDDHNTYNTIMKDKEWLLSFDCPLRFIWSHSALKEGWDNPNVFQVCTLIEQKSTFTCRQKIGRGLRLCVNQEGERIEDKNINILHVMANESFAEFADSLQREIEQETGVKFGLMQISLFSGVTYTETKTVEKKITVEQAEKTIEILKKQGVINDNGKVEKNTVPKKIELPEELEEVKAVVETLIANAIEKSEPLASKEIAGEVFNITTTEEKTITYDDAAEIITHFENKGYVSKSGQIKDTMKNALLNGTLDLPKKYEAARERFETIINQSDKRVPIRNASKDVIVKMKSKVLDDPKFAALWEKIQQKTTYRVNIDTDELVKRSVKMLKEMPKIPKARILSKTADFDIKNTGVTHFEKELKTTNVQNDYSIMPDIVTIVGEEALLTPKTVCKILTECGRIKEFVGNPQAFIEQSIDIIRANRHSLAVDGISYIKLDGEYYYAQEIFDSTELLANIDKNAVEVKNSVYDYVIYDSDTVEKPFAVALDDDPEVKMFFKLPKRFKIDTPIGTYNPDWAVYLDRNGEEKMYFVLETKGSTSLLDLRMKEELKIQCGKKHFIALDKDVELRVDTNWNNAKKGF